MTPNPKKSPAPLTGGRKTADPTALIDRFHDLAKHRLLGPLDTLGRFREPFPRSMAGAETDETRDDRLRD